MALETSPGSCYLLIRHTDLVVTRLWAMAALGSSLTRGHPPCCWVASARHLAPLRPPCPRSSLAPLPSLVVVPLEPLDGLMLWRTSLLMQPSLSAAQQSSCVLLPFGLLFFFSQLQILEPLPHPYPRSTETKYTRVGHWKCSFYELPQVCVCVCMCVCARPYEH